MEQRWDQSPIKPTWATKHLCNGWFRTKHDFRRVGCTDRAWIVQCWKCGEEDLDWAGELDER